MIFLDYETYSECDLKACGATVYAKHPSTKILLAAWYDTDTAEMRLYDSRADKNTDALKAALLKADSIHAWNAPFEMQITEHVLGLEVPLEKWRCTMAHALYRSLPGSLDACAKALNFDGKPAGYTRLLNLFCVPNERKEKPDDWQKFIEYNLEDVRLEMHVHDWLKENRLGWPGHEIKIWQVTEAINRRGVPIDRERCAVALTAYDALVESAHKKIKEITGVNNPASPTQLCEWITGQGVPCSSIAAAEIERLLSADIPNNIKATLQLRKNSALTAPKKYQAALNTGADGNMYGQAQYSGAGRTHRWAGRGFQVQNVRRGLKDDVKIAKAWDDIFSGRDLTEIYEDPYSLTADLVRSIIRSKDGPLTVSDWSSIEVVMLYWSAYMDDEMDRFARGEDAYRNFAAKHYGVPVSEVTKEQRTFAKPVILGCGYGMGPEALIRYAENMGVEMSAIEASNAVLTYRDTHAKVKQLWYSMQSAFVSAVQGPEGAVYKCGRFDFFRRGVHVIMRLPSKSQITYLNVKLMKDGQGRDQITYMGLNQYTRKWERVKTWGGKLVENAVQSISRDILANALTRGLEAGLPICLHVHDEIVCLPVDGKPVVDQLKSVMTAPEWCKDAPLRCEAFVCESYRKD